MTCQAKKSQKTDKIDKNRLFSENRPASIPHPREPPSKTFTEIVRILNYTFDGDQNCYVFTMCTHLGYNITLKPNPYYTDQEKVPWKLEKNYYWKVVYSGNYEIQSMEKQSWIFPKFMLQFSI